MNYSRSLVIGCLGVLMLAACRDQVPTAPQHRDAELFGPPRMQSIVTPNAPGTCMATFVSPSSAGPDNGALTNQATGCSFPDSALTKITISGMVTAERNPAHVCCFTSTYPLEGTYGPMGMQLNQNLVAKTPITFNGGGSTTAQGWRRIPMVVR